MKKTIAIYALYGDGEYIDEYSELRDNDPDWTLLTEPVEVEFSERGYRVNVEWVSVADRLPDDNVTVIVDSGIGYIREGIWYTVTGERFPGLPIQWEVKCWMPIPDAP